jgi:hypothetical protein
MWIFTTSGFVSIVADRDDPDRLLLRGRVRADLDPLAKEIGAHVHSTPGADYPYRFTASKGDVAEAISRLVNAIDYPNFKDEVAQRQGRGRESAYHEIWAALRRRLPPLDED